MKKYKIGSLLIILLIGFSAPSLFGQEAEHLSDLWEEFTDIPVKRVDRCRDIVGIFKRLGAEDIVIEPIEGGGKCPGNVIVPLKSSVSEVESEKGRGYIIVSSHLDKKGGGVGALDNYSGVLMTAALYRGLKGYNRNHDFLFIAFDREEEGLLGSKAFVKKSTYMAKGIHAVINLECLGLTLPHSWPEGSSDSLEDLFVTVGKRFDTNLNPVSLKHVRTDSVPFLDAGIPAITLDGIMSYDLFILDTELDIPSVVDRTTFFQSYPIILEYILEVDALEEAPDPENDR